jgi:hypothetical protein
MMQLCEEIRLPLACDDPEFVVEQVAEAHEGFHHGVGVKVRLVGRNTLFLDIHSDNLYEGDADNWLAKREEFNAAVKLMRETVTTTIEHWIAVYSGVDAVLRWKETHNAKK